MDDREHRFGDGATRADDGRPDLLVYASFVAMARIAPEQPRCPRVLPQTVLAHVADRNVEIHRPRT